MKDIDKIKAVFITAFTAVHGWLGALAVPFYLLVFTNIVDYITGVYAARCRGEKVCSDIGFRGFAKTVCMWLLVFVGTVVDYIIISLSTTLHIEIGFKYIVAIAVVFWLLANELISLLENIHDIGVDVQWLTMLVELIKEKTEESVDVDNIRDTAQDSEKEVLKE